MKRISLFLASLAFPAMMSAQASGWPEGYGGVMLQAFYWDSFTDTQWSNITAQADELAHYFNLIWVPNSGETSDWRHSKRNTMGYDPCFWLSHNSCFGTEEQLREMINTYKAKGTGFIADVVINHKNGLNSWADFPQESVTGTNTGKKYTVQWNYTSTAYPEVCSTDEANTNASSPVKGKCTGAKDTGDDFSGYRDLDHTNATVQQNVKTYLDFLKNELGYVGFRYDMVKGYAPTYTRTYNEAAAPTYSVGEYWDGTPSNVKKWIDNTGKMSAAFDFPMKYLIKSAFNGDWNKLSTYATATVAGDAKYSRYVVTFVDNHDTGDPASNADPQRANIAAANAFILTMPGTPCVWLSHWKAYQTVIKKCILARKLAGVTNTSSVTSCSADANGCAITVNGTNGSMLLLLGSSSAATTGYQLACDGDNFKLYVSNGLDITEINNVKETTVTHEIPSFCTVADGELCAFFEVPASWGNVSKINCWAWDSKGNYTGNKWPGVSCTLLGKTSQGNAVYKWTWDGKYTGTTATAPTGIIFSAGTGSPQQNDMTFKNGNYYGLTEVYGNVVDIAAGINQTRVANTADALWYNLAGQASTKPHKGINIHHGRKIVVK